MKVALWAVNLAHPVKDIHDWLALVESQIAKAKAQGAEVFAMPEYAALQWLHFAPHDITGPAQLPFMAALVPEAVKAFSALAAKHDLLIASGTMPVERKDLQPPFSNRAHIHFPDGKVITQDKLCLTPFEKDPAFWDLSCGDTLTVFEWKGFRLAVVICLDIEMPSLSARMAPLDIDLVIVPSLTAKLAGFHRVNSCARARAVELMAAVVTCGAIAGPPETEQQMGGMNFFLPAEEKFGHTGVLASLAPAYTAPDAGPLLVGDLPLAEIRAMRKGGAGEVWPGAWKADHVVIKA